MPLGDSEMAAGASYSAGLRGSRISNMSDSRPTDDLGALRWDVALMESGALTLRQNHRDVTKREIGILKREIAFLEKVRDRART
jgi:hypothetical protein